jgi:hypothetical protein
MIQDLLVSIQNYMGISLDVSDVVAGLLSGILLIIFARTALAAKFAASAGALFFENLRRKQRRTNSIEILGGVRNFATLLRIQTEVQFNLFIILVALAFLIIVNLYQIQYALNKVYGNVITESNDIVITFASSYGRWFKLFLSLLIYAAFFLWLENTSKLHAIVMIRAHGRKWITENKTKSMSEPRQLGLRILVFTCVTAVLILFIYGYWIRS